MKSSFSQEELQRVASAKAHVKDFSKGSVVSSKDFSKELLAPTRLIALKGPLSSPLELCSIDVTDGHEMEFKGDGRGSKEELLRRIRQPTNWQGAGARRLQFDVANATSTESTTRQDL